MRRWDNANFSKKKSGPRVLWQNYVRSCVSCFALKPISSITIFLGLSPLSLNHLFNNLSLSLSTQPRRAIFLSSTTAMSSHRCLLILMLLLIFFVISSAARLSNSASLETSSRNHRHTHHFKGQRHSCGSFPHKISRSLCIQFQRMNGKQHFGAEPPSSPIEIDPRYGVEKRLVPSGPNPLHNWRVLITSSQLVFINHC